ncbi:MAG: nucleotide pyrophosphohydrolase [Thermoguttaceae bacterium]|nr:nucleotide pyrophosphohydrolase [Thermoguttaceae bacterium]MDW8078743.1 nucleotide pyrophosphohydrolase [Thermoguttaceae bacterium]
MDDQSTTLAQLREMIQRFVAERDWGQFHTPKNLAMSLAIEAAEVMEVFQWLTPEESWSLREECPEKEALCDELADVLAYLLAISNQLNIDLASALKRKMAKNEAKYPVEEYRGRYGPRDNRAPR